ncbi:MAG TPA: hypothetical protein PLD62_05990 [Candidatus Cloacimonadota bacterium]|nr:hypothetical protein [Candidatus Cloacimonadota bacterium]
MNWIIVLPVVFPIAVAIFVFITRESLWKKLSVLAVFILLSCLKFLTSNVTIILLGFFLQVILFILLLIYFRNRDVI